MLEISCAYRAQGPLGAARGLRGPKRLPLGVVKMTPLSSKNIFSIKNVENTNESIWMTAESYGGLIWGSKALGGNLSLPGVAPRGVKNHP